MKTPELPYATTEYISRNFHEDFLFEVKEAKQIKGRWQFTVEVSKDDFIHTLQFDERGALIKEEAEPAFPAEAHEGPVPEDVPE